MLHRDGLILVIDKPAGLAVHAGPSGAPNLEECFDDLRFGLPRPPSLAHRLDADTAGVLVLGRHPKALAKLRAKLAKNKNNCALFDTDLFRRNIEAAYDRMWRRWLAGEKPEGFAGQAKA